MCPKEEPNVQNLVDQSRIIRRTILEMYAAAGGGHFGGSLSVVEILVALYGSVLRVDPARPQWEDRDRLILSKGHSAGALCAVLGHYGFFDKELLETFNKLDSPFGMHPDMHKIPGCDMSSGSLGHGLAVGCGMALAARADGKDYRVYVIVGDGECQEGSIWEAAMVAAHHKLNNLIVVVDRNMVSLDGKTEEINALEPLSERWRSFGRSLIEVDGHDLYA
jgi:transketolase